MTNVTVFCLILVTLFRSELPCCRPCKNEAGYKANITIPVTCEQNATCNSTDNRCCLAPFVEGCACPDGQYFDGIKCVNMTHECNRPCVSSSSSSTTSSTTRWACFNVFRFKFTRNLPFLTLDRRRAVRTLMSPFCENSKKCKIWIKPRRKARLPLINL